jgi:uncharacterized membrane protein SpoIIM required for sporulation
MKETGFIKQNKEKWIEFEKILRLNRKDPDRLSSLFIQITDDLSYSRTFYPNRSVRVYLNNIAQQVFHSIYKSKRERGKRFGMFWKNELPRVVYESGRELRLSLIVFVLSMAIGIISCHNDPEFMRLILGDSYVEMTKANIESGDPMAVYKKMHQVDMVLAITYNNIQVAFLTFLFGILCGVGSIGILVSNGIMVGVFQYFFIQRGLFLESFLSIWLHGTLEIASIIIAGGAGITLGKGLVFPGTHSRIEAFQITARRGLKLLLGVVPIIVFAAIIESFLTRYTDMPWLNATVIFISWVFILGYFVWYPIMKARKGFEGPSLESKLPPTVDQHIDCNTIKSNGEIFSDTFIFLKKHARVFFLVCIGLAAAYAALFGIFFHHDAYYTFNFEYDRWYDIFVNAFLYLGDLGLYFSYENRPLLMIANVILFSVLSSLCAQLWLRTANEETGKATWLINFLKSVLVLGIMSITTWVHPALYILLLLTVYPPLILWLFITQGEKRDIFTAIGRMFTIMGSRFFNLLGLNFMFILISMIILFLISSPIFWAFFGMLNWGFDLSAEVYQLVFKIVITFSSFVTLGLLFLMVLSGSALFYYSAREVTEARSLKEKIMNLRAGKMRGPAYNEA